MPSWNDSKPCPVCGFEGDLGPSDHFPTCPAFMRGAVGLEGEQQLPFGEVEAPEPVFRHACERCDRDYTNNVGASGLCPACVLLPALEEA